MVNIIGVGKGTQTAADGAAAKKKHVTEEIELQKIRRKQMLKLDSRSELLPGHGFDDVGDDSKV